MTAASASMPTILHMMSMRSTKLGALEDYMLELVRLCADKGYRSMLQYEELPRSTEYLARLDSAGAQLIVTPVLSRPSQRGRAIVNTWELMRKARPAILQTHFTDSVVSLVAPVAARKVGARKAFALRHSNVSGRESGLKWMLQKKLLRASAERYDQVLVVSEHVHKAYLAMGVNPKKVSTHHLGLFGNRDKSMALRSRFRSYFRISEEAVVFAIIAFDTPFKGLDILLPAFKEAAKGLDHVHLVVIGVDSQASSLPNLAVQLEIGERVHWAGIRDRGWEVLCAADIYVQSSRFGEGLNLSTLEAMALGLPVVATNVSGMNGEAVVPGETGELCDPGSIESLASAMRSMLGKRDAWRIMGQAGKRRFDRHFRGDVSVRRLVEEHYAI